MERDVAELMLAQRYDDAARLLEHELAACDDAMRKLALLKDLGTLRRDQLGDIEGAMHAYRQALEIDCTDGDALRALLSIYEMVGDWAQLVGLHQTMADLAEDTDELVLHLMVAARILEEQLGDPRSSGELAQRVLDIEPAHDEARAMLARAR